MSSHRRQLPSDQNASGRTLGEEEVRAVTEALRSGVLTSTKGSFVPGLERDFAGWLGARHAVAASSGTAAVHAAVAALDPEPGDEFVTTPITDMGALATILYQGAIPVFADVDAVTGNVTAETLAARIGPRTRALVVTHLFGHPCAMGPIGELAAAHGLPVIEDCAQAYGATTGGRKVGGFGTLACWSLQQGKHVTAGEGGLVSTDDDSLARRVRLFVNKAWGYGDPTPDHEFLALNYRMNELTGAVARAQLAKLDDVVATRAKLALRLREALADVPGVAMPPVAEGDVHSWWRVPLRIDDRVHPGGPRALAARLLEFGIASAPRYIDKPAFQCRVFREQRTFGASRWPFTEARPEALDWSPSRFPGTFDFLAHVLVLPWNERYDERDVDALAEALGEAAREGRA